MRRLLIHCAITTGLLLAIFDVVRGLTRAVDHKTGILLQLPTENLQAASDVDLALTPVIKKQLSDYGTTLSAPIFFSDRMLPRAAPEREQAPTASPVAPSESVLLRGVLIDANGQRVLIETPAGQSRWYKHGDKVAGWTISEVTDQEVRLKAGSREQRVRLYRSPSGR